MDKKFTELKSNHKQLIFDWVKTDIEKCMEIWEMKKVVEKYGVIKEMMKDKEYNEKMKKLVCDFFKEYYKYNRDNFFPSDFSEVINQGCHTENEYGETWDYWYLLNFESEIEAEKFIKKNGSEYGIYLEADEIHSAYDCTGQIFSWHMRIKKVGKNRILCKKHYGRDV